MEKKSILIIILIISIIILSVAFVAIIYTVGEENLLNEQKVSHVAVRNSEVVKFSSFLEGVSQNPNSKVNFSFRDCEKIVNISDVGAGMLNCSFDEDYIFGIIENETNEKNCESICGISTQNCSGIRYFSSTLAYSIFNICLNLEKGTTFSNDGAVCGIEDNYSIVSDIKELKFEDFLIKNASEDVNEPVICLYKKNE